MKKLKLRITNLVFATTVFLVVIMTFGLYLKRAERGNPHHDRADVRGLLQVANDDKVESDDKAFAVVVHRPAGPPRVALAGVDPQGRRGEVACSTCHSVRKANLENKTTDTLNEFHEGLVVNHGKLACYACHNPDDSDSLRLADGTNVAYQDVMTLCSQCHGQQATAFAHGAHGGMNGHWDLTRGPQMKNNCVDCHDPHSPSFPSMIVDFKPKDRFNAPAEHDQEGQ
ncbi:MAG: cytochrome c3 family protein [Rubripirellula sp.]|nr:cytochrome c3 family protein [Rubripirellula sp.]